jgi:predicted transcriptional regulator
MTATKTMTLRLSPELSELLTTVARVEHLSQAAVIRRALNHHLRARAAEPEFVALYQAAQAEQDEAVRALLLEAGVDPGQPLDAIADRLVPAEQVADYLAHLSD